MSKMTKKETKKKLTKTPGFYNFKGDITKTNKNGDNILIQAAKEQDQDFCLKIMEETEIDVNHKNNMGDTALKFFTIGGKIDCIKKFIEKGGDINVKMYYGYTALMLAAYRGLTNVVKLLIDNGANIKETDDEGYNAIMHAGMTGSVETFKLLMENIKNDKGFINKTNNYGNTVLMEATFFNKKDMIKEIITMGANKDITNKEGLNACDIAIQEWLDDNVKIPEKIRRQKDVEKRKLLTDKFLKEYIGKKALKIKALFNEKSPDEIPLIQAIRKKDTKKAITLLKENGDVIDWGGHSGYDWAIFTRPSKKNPEKRKEMIEKINKIFGKYNKI